MVKTTDWLTSNYDYWKLDNLIKPDTFVHRLWLKPKEAGDSSPPKKVGFVNVVPVPIGTGATRYVYGYDGTLV